MGDIKTPRQAKGSRALKILQKTSTSVFMSKLPPRSNRNLHHAHALRSARQVRRIDRQPWEERVADILNVVEVHRHDRANALHAAVERANLAMTEAIEKKAEVETYAEEMQAANEEMRAANEEMRANNEEMRAANEELRAVSEELERIHGDQERFVPLAEKELAQPLSKFAAFAQSAAARGGDQLDPENREQLKFISDHALVMQQKLEKMLTYWRVDIEGKTLETTDCEKLLLQILVQMQAMVQERRVQVTHDPLPDALVDAGQFTQLLKILIANAIQYGPPTGAEVHIRAEDIGTSDIRVPKSEIELGWIFSVSDNGRGIDPKDFKRIFQIYESLNGEKKERIGMGLAIAWRIVKRHGGHIWVESAGQGKGSTFYFTIPEYEIPEGEENGGAD